MLAGVQAGITRSACAALQACGFKDHYAVDVLRPLGDSGSPADAPIKTRPLRPVAQRYPSRLPLPFHSNPLNWLQMPRKDFDMVIVIWPNNLALMVITVRHNACCSRKHNAYDLAGIVMSRCFTSPGNVTPSCQIESWINKPVFNPLN